MGSSRLGAILHELSLGVRERNARRQERKALIVLGQTIASDGPPDDLDLLQLIGPVRQGGAKLENLGQAVIASLDSDRADYVHSARWMRPVVVLRGLCIRAVLRHHVTLGRRALEAPEEAVGAWAANRPEAFARHPERVKAVADARAYLRQLKEERRRRLDPYGGSALPSWLPHFGRESTVLGRALWLQLKPNILPRGSAMVGLAVGWWLANTYTDSHFRSALRSLGLGSGGKRVVSGETYDAMMFWLPLLAAAVFAYLADRAHLLIQRRYNRPTSPS
jgi:hypothetical protein